MKNKDVLIWGGIIGGAYLLLSRSQNGQPFLAPIFGGTGATVIPAADNDFTSDEDIGVPPVTSPQIMTVTSSSSSSPTSRNVSNTPSLAIWNKPEIGKNNVTQAILDQYGITKEHLANWDKTPYGIATTNAAKNPINTKPVNPTVKPVEYVQISGVSKTTGQFFALPPKPKGYY
jgi:hypothetical protein